MKRGLMFLLIALILLINVNVISAIVNVGNLSHSITTKYAPRDFIKGWINISLSNEPTDSLFETSFGDPISLIDLIKLNTISYSCIPTDCETAYVEVADSESTTKTFDIGNTNGGKVIGLKITGTGFESVSSFSIDVSSNAIESDNPQLFIDILNDNDVEWQSYVASSNFRDSDYGCYIEPATTLAEIIPTKEYCNKLILPPSPSVKIGAGITQEQGTSQLRLSIDDREGNSGYCDVTATTTGEISCVPNFKINEEKEVYVCIKEESGNGKYSINYENTDTCGYAGTQAGFDFNIYVQSAKYATLSGSVIQLNDAELVNYGTSLDIKEYINNYISFEYENDCSNGCYIPIRFYGRVQTITLSTATLSYEAGVPKSTDKIYDLTEVSAKVSSDFKKLSLNKANFSVPDEFGPSDFTLTLDGTEIFSEEISIEKVPQIISLRPTTVMAAYPTTFFMEVETFDLNITSYKWNFGNGEIKTTTENKIVYAYPALGKYNLTITITTQEQVNSSKSFSIESKSPKGAVNTVLGKKLSDFSNLKNKIEALPLFYQDSLRLILNLSTIESKLAELQRKNATASSDQNYVNIMKDLIELQFPQAIASTAKADSIPFYPIEESINLDVLREIGRGNYTTKNKEKYIDAILAWNIENLETKIDFERISLLNENSEEQVLNFFNINIEKKNTTSSPYFIIQKLENLRFKESYSSKETSGYIYIPITDSEMTITFSTTEDVDFTNIPAFISPKISELSIEGFVISEESKKWIIRFVIALGGILFMGFILYIILQGWYKRKYENYLFKNRNYLYNLATYIQNSKKSGIEDKEIFSKLKKAGWRSEQIRYVIRKYYGKRTGMFEIPIKKIFGVFKKKEKFEQGNFYQQYK